MCLSYLWRSWDNKCFFSLVVFADVMAHDDGWLRKIVHVTLVISLAYQLYEFVEEVSVKDVGVSMSSSWDDMVTYPSLTICPQPGKLEFDNLLAVSSRDWLTLFQHKMYFANG